MVSKRKGTLRDWYAALLARKPARASVAMANKLARIAWPMMATGEALRTLAFERAHGACELGLARTQ